MYDSLDICTLFLECPNQLFLAMKVTSQRTGGWGWL